MYTAALETVIGHSCCTALAVVRGRYVSTKISVKHGSYPLVYRDGFPGDSVLSSHGGSILFLLFGLIYFYEAMSINRM